MGAIRENEISFFGCGSFRTGNPLTRTRIPEYSDHPFLSTTTAGTQGSRQEVEFKHGLHSNHFFFLLLQGSGQKKGVSLDTRVVPRVRFAQARNDVWFPFNSKC